ncbi:hypothetical protein ABGB19_15190 [Mycobacterium sp. B14F4]|uniref:alpha/beta hydrolase family protein n=1 Tax=Mycobacterium sp. B14F4 TaxID=3153565 RepID=UPI00325D612F
MLGYLVAVPLVAVRRQPRINTAYLDATGTLRSSCGGRPPTVAAVSTMYPAMDPAGLWHNDDPVVGGQARATVGAYTGGSPEQFPKRYEQIASATHISAAAPPTLIVAPRSDHLVPVGGTYRFVERARAAGNPTRSRRSGGH